MKIEMTSDRENQTVNLLVYGRSKVGKTRLISTAESPFIISIEDSMLSLRNYKIPYVSVKDMKSLAEVMAWLSSPEAMQYKTICIDSISELGDLIVESEKMRVKDARLAYGAMQEEIFKIIRAIRAMPFDFYVIAKADKYLDMSGATVFSPALPGNKAAVKMPYLFDVTLALRNIMMEGANEPETLLQCKEDGVWEAGDKSGKLEMWEKPDLGAIFDKIKDPKASARAELKRECILLGTAIKNETISLEEGLAKYMDLNVIAKAKEIAIDEKLDARLKELLSTVL